MWLKELPKTSHSLLKLDIEGKEGGRVVGNYLGNN